jgi:hypothetical protein
VAGQDGGREFLGFSADHEAITAVGAEEERIDVMDVDLGPQQDTGDVLKLGLRLQLDRHDRDVVMRETVLIQDLLGALRVIDHDTDDRRIGRVHQTQGHDVDVGSGQRFDQLIETADLVLDEDGELADRSEVGLLGEFGGHLLLLCHNQNHSPAPFPRPAKADLDLHTHI